MTVVKKQVSTAMSTAMLHTSGHSIVSTNGLTRLVWMFTPAALYYSIHTSHPISLVPKPLCSLLNTNKLYYWCCTNRPQWLTQQALVGDDLQLDCICHHKVSHCAEYSQEGYPGPLHWTCSHSFLDCLASYHKWTQHQGSLFKQRNGQMETCVWDQGMNNRSKWTSRHVWLQKPPKNLPPKPLSQRGVRTKITLAPTPDRQTTNHISD